MPHGVAHEFIRLLEQDRRAAGLRLVLAGVLAAALTGVAWFVTDPWGPAIVGGGVLVGAGAGAWVAHAVVRRREDSLRGQWSEWMRLATACESVLHLARRVRGKGLRDAMVWGALALTFVWAAEVALLYVHFSDTTSFWAAAPVLGLNGFAAGYLIGYLLRTRSWYSAFRASLDDMVQAGELGVWGVA